MFFNKCKKCGGKKAFITTSMEIKINGKLRKFTNVPAKQCVKCGNIIVSDFVLERIKQYAQDYSSTNLDFAKCEDEESVAAQTLF